jgi:hypothetical protein
VFLTHGVATASTDHASASGTSAAAASGSLVLSHATDAGVLLIAFRRVLSSPEVCADTFLCTCSVF